MEGIMFDARRRQLGWLFFLLLVGISHGQGPATTVVSDVVFRAEDRINSLEKTDIQRGVYDGLLNAVIAVVISLAIAMRDHFGIK
ncbi:MAG: hypothetical protein DMG84_18440 [Acidobacteria bacterium]|nr:MAG: hypothetical protein DMG84_18440 [Acidobacteriota bacterium]